MTNIAIVYHSGFGHTAVVAEHVAKGAGSVPGVTARLY
jgi:flavodoxin